MSMFEVAQTNVTPQSHIATTSAYNPYSGKEALDLIMKRIFFQLKEYQFFGQHLSYDKFAYNFTLTINTGEIVPATISGTGQAELRLAEKSFTVTGTSPAAPDEGRREVGLPIPMPQVSTGGVVDIPMHLQEGQV